MARYFGSLARVAVCIFATTVYGATDAIDDCLGANAVHPLCKSSETPHVRDFFYLGGRHVQMATGNVTVDQVYVEKLIPLHGAKKTPLVFFHGGGTSAVTWLNTPDNR